MASRARSKPAKPRAAAAAVPPPRSRAIAGWLGLSFVLGSAALIILSTLRVPLGQGYFFFRYSDITAMRTIRATPALAVAAAFCGAVWLLGNRDARRRRAGVAVFCGALVAT